MNLIKNKYYERKVYTDNPKKKIQILESLFASGLMNQLFVYSQF